jgi:Ca2+-transporting ATPase
MGQLAEMLGGVEKEQSPLERRLEHFGTRVARWVVALSATIVVGGLATQGPAHFSEIFLFAVALAVAAVPEGLPAVLTVTLSLGVERMARRKAVVRKLAAVESLGSVTVIATDKTGTLTENKMEVRRLDSPNDARALTAMVLANDADRDTCAGDPLELALLDYAASSGHDIAATIRENPRCDERPFDSQWKFMRATCRSRETTSSYLKGAPEVLLARTSLTESEREHWRQRIDHYAGEGFRLLALAASDRDKEDALEWLGLVLLWDPPRPEVAGAVREARDAGIRVVMITGDHPATASNVAGLVGIEHDRIVTGDDLDACETRDEFDALACAGHVLARVSPEHKLHIVEALQRNGEIVAVTGDGVNDAPALKRADVGVAMGERGSDVSREVADLVLLDDNFATIVAAIEEGRSIYENIEKFIRFLFSTNLAEVVVVGGGAFAALVLGLSAADGSLLLPLTAAQLLWINLVTDGAPALALGLDRNPGVMQHAPRDATVKLLDRPSLTYVGVAGAITATLAILILALLGSVAGQSSEVVRTATFAFLATGQLFFAYPARHTDLRPSVNITLHGAIAASLLVQAAVLSLPTLMIAFDAVALTPVAMLWVASSILVACGVAEFATRMIWRGRRRLNA